MLTPVISSSILIMVGSSWPSSSSLRRLDSCSGIQSVMIVESGSSAGCWTGQKSVTSMSCGTTTRPPGCCCPVVRLTPTRPRQTALFLRLGDGHVPPPQDAGDSCRRSFSPASQWCYPEQYGRRRTAPRYIYGPRSIFADSLRSISGVFSLPGKPRKVSKGCQSRPCGHHGAAVGAGLVGEYPWRRSCSEVVGDELGVRLHRGQSIAGGGEFDSRDAGTDRPR